MVQEEGLVRFDVATDDSQQEIRFSHHRVALENLGVLSHCGFEAQKRVAAMAHELDVREHRDVQPDLLTVE